MLDWARFGSPTPRAGQVTAQSIPNECTLRSQALPAGNPTPDRSHEFDRRGTTYATDDAPTHGIHPGSVPIQLLTRHGTHARPARMGLLSSTGPRAIPVVEQAAGPRPHAPSLDSCRGL
jgi:hypothetical protein